MTIYRNVDNSKKEKKTSRMTTPELNDCQQRWLPLEEIYNLKTEYIAVATIEWSIQVCACVCVCAAWNGLPATDTFFGWPPSSSNPIHVEIERSGEGRERVCASGASLLSSSGRAGAAQSGRRTLSVFLEEQSEKCEHKKSNTYIPI